MTINPDTKDWTWTVARVCDECGFDPEQVTFENLPQQIRQQVQDWAQVLSRPNVSERPRPQSWSPLEYGAHVRDVLQVMRGRVELMLSKDNPDLPSWDQDEAAVAGNYRNLNPILLADEIGIEASMTAAAYARLAPEQAARPGRRTDGSEFTIESLGKYLLHDLVHHAWDVRA